MELPTNSGPPTDLGGLRLRLRDELNCSLQQVAGKIYFLVEDPLNQKFYRMGEREWRFCRKLDGQRTLREVLRLVAAEAEAEDQHGPPLSQTDAVNLCRWLMANQLVEPLAAAQTGPDAAPAAAVAEDHELAALTQINPLFLKIPLFNPDHLLGRLLPYCRWMLTPAAFVVWLAVLLVGLASVMANWTRFSDSFSHVWSADNWLLLFATWFLLKIVHELFHGLVCKKYGGSVPRCGVMFIMLSPVAFVDVTSSWRFRSKWQRIFTSAAGMYVEFFLAALAAILWARQEPGVIAQTCRNVITAASLSTLLFNGNFLMRFDGYYIVTDLLDIQNLYTLGRQHITYLTRRHFLGLPAAEVRAAGSKLLFIKCYGLASLVWRMFFYVGIVVVASHLFRGAGIVLAVGSGLAWFALPAWRFVQYVRHGKQEEQPDRRRMAAVAAAAFAVVGLAAMLPWPGGISAPAVVEYAPLALVRAESAGFVTQICVQSGDFVSRGQVLAYLTNPVLEQQLRDIELLGQQAELKCRILRDDNELAQYQAELQQSKSLVEKRDELQRRVAQLTVRAPEPGRVIGRQLATLAGRYLEIGDELLAIGDENRKELRVSIAQSDVTRFREWTNRPVRVRAKGRSCPLGSALLSRVNPRATSQVPHVALTGPLGGPLAVIPHSAAVASPESERLQLLDPRFTAIVTLSSDDARQLRVGELANVRILRSGETVGQHSWLLLQRFIRSKQRDSTT